MIRRLRLERFKNFKEAELVLGPLTTLVGTNASGKSNIRDAFRFLHGIARGYTLAEIIGEKWIEGEKQWSGIRGGMREIAYQDSSSFALEVDFDTHIDPQVHLIGIKGKYHIQIALDPRSSVPRVVKESLYLDEKMMFDSHPPKRPASDVDAQHLKVWMPPGGKKYRKAHTETFISNRPVLSQVSDKIADRRDRNGQEVRKAVEEALTTLEAMRFLDLSPDAMRQPSFPGQSIGDRGENLSSVLQTICGDPRQKKTLIEWIQELTPMDCVDFEFPADQIGRVLVTLIEKNGHKISAYSASDGTLRFLGLMAALLNPESARFYFIEELENGIHPTRLHLLLQLIEQRVASENLQMVATTHSPQLLGLLSLKSLESASLVYRLPDTPEGRIRRIMDVADAKRLIKDQHELAALHASGWMEDAVYFTADIEDTP